MYPDTVHHGAISISEIVAVRSGNVREDASVNVAGNIRKAEIVKETRALTECEEQWSLVEN